MHKLLKMEKSINTKNKQRGRCFYKCVQKEHGDQICEAIRIEGSTEDQSISYMHELCENFCFVLDSDGRSALHTAALHGKTKVIHFLVTHGANINFQEKVFMRTPLHFACLSRNIGVAIILLQYGADSKVEDSCGLSPTNYLIIHQPRKCLPRFLPCELPLQGYSWGINANYNLGLASAHPKEYPEHIEVPLPKGSFLSSVSMNKFHTVLLSSCGKVYVCGHGRGGRLGFETDTSVIVPQYVKVSKHRITKISAGIDHTLFLNENHEVLSCGLNKFHQLGIVPLPSQLSFPKVLRQWHSKFSDVEVIGVAAGTYHTAIWSKYEIYTCGLNAGQLGHDFSQNEMFIDLPRSPLFSKCLNRSQEEEIMEVVVSEGATVLATTLGRVFACCEYKIRHISLNDVAIINKITCIGGPLDTNKKFEPLALPKPPELKIAMVTTCNTLIVWSNECTTKSLSSEINIWRMDHVYDFCLSVRGLCIVNIQREVFFGCLESKATNDILPMRDKADSNNFNLVNNKKRINFLKIIKQGKVIVSLYRTHSLFCDPQGNNFVALQYEPSLFLKNYIKYNSNSLVKDISNYYSKTLTMNGIYDVEVIVGHRRFPAHSYILCSHSEYLYEMLLACIASKRDDHFDLSKSVNEVKMEIVLHNIDDYVFEQMLVFMYHKFESDLSFCDSRGFIEYSSGGGSLNSRQDNFVHIYRKSDNEIVERGKKGRLIDVGYPLKALKDASCILKMKNLQDFLLFLNEMTISFESLNSKLYIEDMVPEIEYDRMKFPEFWDVSFQCEDGKVLRAHKCILMARSSYFEAMLGFWWTQTRDGSDSIDISLPSTLLRIILDFLYTNEFVEVSESRDLNFLCNLLAVSHQYMIEDLHIHCQRSIAKVLTFKNSIDLLRFSVTYDATFLKVYILEFICINLPYYFDLRHLKNLSREMIEPIDATYRKMTLPYDAPSIDCSIEEMAPAKKKEAIFQIRRHKRGGKLHYVAAEPFDIVQLATTTQTDRLPTLKDLQTSLSNNYSVVHQTLEEWLEKGKEYQSSPHTPQKAPNPERKRKSSNKKRTRKSSSSSQASSTGSNSESESALELGENTEPFSFEDLEDKMSEAVPIQEEEWKVVKKGRNESGEAEGVSKIENEFKELKIGIRKEAQDVSFPNLSETWPPRATEACPTLDNSSFPTFSEAQTLFWTTPNDNTSQHKRMPRFQSKSNRKSKKSLTNAPEEEEEEEQTSPIQPRCPWGLGTQDAGLSADLRSEPSFTTFSPNKDEAATSITSPIQIKRSSDDESLHWNPVTKTVVISPKDEASSFSFTSIMQEEVTYKKNLELQRNKPLSLIQLEEKAIRELRDYYGGEYNPEERVTVRRYGVNTDKPSWNIQYSNV